MTYIAFLRAINVGGTAVVKMDAVRDAFASCGCASVRTFIASGNVLFDAAPRDVRRLVVAVRARLGVLVGKQPDIILRTAGEIEAMVASNPFHARTLRPGETGYVALLTAAPATHAPLPIVVDKEAFRIVDIVGADAFIGAGHKPDGRPGNPNAYLEKVLGVRATMRTWNTIVRLAALAASTPRRPTANSSTRRR